MPFCERKKKNVFNFMENGDFYETSNSQAFVVFLSDSVGRIHAFHSRGLRF